MIYLLPGAGFLECPRQRDNRMRPHPSRGRMTDSERTADPLTLLAIRWKTPHPGHFAVSVAHQLRPEDREGFRYPNLLAWARKQRGRLLCAALTMLSASCRAGKPGQDLRPWGSFDGWTELAAPCGGVLHWLRPGA